MEKKKLLYLAVNDCNTDELTDEIVERIGLDEKIIFVTPNLDFLRLSYKNSKFRIVLNNSTFSTVDGTPLIWLSKLFRTKIRNKIPGSDFTIKFLQTADQQSYRIFILGGKEGVAEQAKLNLEKEFSNLIISGYYSPPIGFEKDEQELKTIEKQLIEANPDCVLVCLGAPKQEFFVYDNWEKLPNAAYFCVGATVNFIAGDVKRAPKLFSKLGMEWLYRMCKEPRRLFKRYFLDFCFLIKIIFVRIFNKKKIEKLYMESVELEDISEGIKCVV